MQGPSYMRIPNDRDTSQEIISSSDKSKYFTHPIYSTCQFVIPPKAQLRSKFCHFPLNFIVSEITSNLTLQKFLYFNMLFSIMFYYCMIVILIYHVYQPHFPNSFFY